MTKNKIQINDQQIGNTKPELENLSLREMEKVRGGHYCETYSIGSQKWEVCSDDDGDVSYRRIR